ncbi:MAG TPA: flagellar motor switch protein FliN [Anaerolinea thermolimosa]|uniref:Flagellar motor switch protein FliN n=1 Tax=Anaerolinea thermolimosa TaxID=229919 RepID=A0A3D1JF79_9CHLR|nr:flagellar motor switch protein FliN [Anaerolinea thermolimosa]GAP07917.1 flagellar motor switch protein FliN [Anaerolinea thermolimosa]HCE16266.1 flagellar motor switch protein FliN [Anaerolinea thermolimosa]
MSDQNELVHENIGAVSRLGEGNGNGKSLGDLGNIDLLLDVPLRITVELGRTRLQLRQVIELQQGSVIELDRLAGDPVDIFINERLFARGEVIVVDDKFGVRITELISPNGEKGAA